MAVNEPTDGPEFGKLVRVFARIGCLSFGGPAGQIALMHGEIVEKHQWVDEEQYLHALNFCHLLPGPEAQQLATWIGWRLHGLKGGLAAGLLFVIPGALVMLALSTLYALAANLDWFAALFLGIKAAVLAIVVQALIRIGGRALNTRFKQALAVAAFLGLFLFNLPFPLVVLGAGVIGILVAAQRPEWLALKANPNALLPPRPPIMAMVRTVLLWGVIWAMPMALVLVTLGQSHVLWDIGVFFSQLAVVTFGGAYAVLAYMAQEAVQSYGWIQAGEMADGLGLAETTPGPLNSCHPACRLSCGLPVARALLSARCGTFRCRPDDLGDVCALFLMDIHLCTVDRAVAARDTAQGRFGGPYGSGRRRDCQPVGLVCAPCLLRTGGHSGLRSDAVGLARLDQL